MQFRQEMAHRAMHLQQELDHQEEEEYTAMAAANLFKPRPVVEATATSTLLHNNYDNDNTGFYNAYDGSLGVAPDLALVGLSSTEALTEGVSSSLHLLSSSQEQGLGPGLGPGPEAGATTGPLPKSQKPSRGKSHHTSKSQPPSQEPRFVLSREGLLVKPPDPNVNYQNSQRRTNSRGLSAGNSAQRRTRGGGGTNPLAASAQGPGLGAGPGLGPGGEQEIGFEERSHDDRSQTPLVWPDRELLHRMTLDNLSPAQSPTHKGQWADSMSDR